MNLKRAIDSFHDGQIQNDVLVHSLGLTRLM